MIWTSTRWPFLKRSTAVIQASVAFSELFWSFGCFFFFGLFLDGTSQTQKCPLNSAGLQGVENILTLRCCDKRVIKYFLNTHGYPEATTTEKQLINHETLFHFNTIFQLIVNLLSRFDFFLWNHIYVCFFFNKKIIFIFELICSQMYCKLVNLHREKLVFDTSQPPEEIWPFSTERRCCCCLFRL